MSVSPEFVEETLHRLREIGELHPKRMFGGVGLYHRGLFFALLAGDQLYFKVDDSSRPDYEAMGMSAFAPGGKEMRGYFEVPARVQENTQIAAEWAKRAIALAETAARKKQGRKAARSQTRAQRSGEQASSDGSKDRVSTLKNLGPVSSSWLVAVRIETREDLERCGSAAAFRAIREAGFEPSLNLLWALEGALLGLKGTELPDPLKESLRQRVGDL